MASACTTPRVFYGGTFDPVHDGHLAIATGAADAIGVPVAMMPAADPPHRAAPGATAQQRAQMLSLAIQHEPRLTLDTRELQRAQQHPGQPSWTVDTLREVRAELGPGTPVILLLGADSLVGLPGWHQWQSLLTLAHFVVAERPGSPINDGLPPVLAEHLAPAWADEIAALWQAPAGRVWRLQQPLRGESATKVRAAVAAGRAIEAMVPAAVADYIRVHGLYGAA